MATLPTSAQDQALLALVSSAVPSSIGDVIVQMQAIDALLTDNDGLKWFNRLYLMVTQEVDMNPPGGAWQNPQWLLHLDVVFAGLYFSAIREYLSGANTPSAWAALFEARFRNGIDHIQFAMAGMNAHINRDLAMALLQTDEDLHVQPAWGSAEHRDYLAVNALLRNVTPAAMAMLSSGALGELAEGTGNAGRKVAAFDMLAARDASWDFACRMRELPSVARDAALAAQDAITGQLGRTILTVF